MCTLKFFQAHASVYAKPKYSNLLNLAYMVKSHFYNSKVIGDTNLSIWLYLELLAKII